MKHRDLETLKTEAAVVEPTAMTKRDRLLRWAEALEARAGARLATLWGVEYAPRRDRLEMRQEQSPLTVAYADPVLREAGLKDDTYGAALQFFELSDAELHRLVCRCHFGAYVASERVAARLRAKLDSPMARMSQSVTRIVARARAAFA